MLKHRSFMLLVVLRSLSIHRSLILHHNLIFIVHMSWQSRLFFTDFSFIWIRKTRATGLIDCLRLFSRLNFASQRNASFRAHIALIQLRALTLLSFDVSKIVLLKQPSSYFAILNFDAWRLNVFIVILLPARLFKQLMELNFRLRIEHRRAFRNFTDIKLFLLRDLWGTSIILPQIGIS